MRGERAPRTVNRQMVEHYLFEGDVLGVNSGEFDI